MDNVDPGLLQDFLTESSELIEQLDADLVKLEGVAESEQADLLNSCFRALHTIKGAASFLGLTNVINFAHVAEDALNRLRKGEVAVTPDVMDALLASADIVREQIEAMSAGDEAPEGPAELVATLHAIVNGSAGETPAASSTDEAANGGAEDASLPGEPLELGAQKLDLLEFMVADLAAYAAQIDDAVVQLGNDATRADATLTLTEIADNLVKTSDFFELTDLTALCRMLHEWAPKLAELDGAQIPEIAVRISALKWLVEQQGEALMLQRAMRWPLETFQERFQAVAAGEELPADVAGGHEGDVAKLLVLDGVMAAEAAEAPEPVAAQEAEGASEDTNAKSNDTAKATRTNVVEQTIRVEVGRLESLLNLVGQLVLNKNRVLGLTRNLRDGSMSHDAMEDFAAAAGDLDRLTGELQVGVMRTRMQPLAKLFDRYPRVIRDMARMTEKKLEIEILGKETEVDKSVLESLADPLVHILRNSADHGVESPEDRKAAGKNETGRITLEAEHQGSHVRVAITDDGKGLDRDVIGAKAIERGLVTADQLATLSDSDVFRFIFEAGFSTAKQVSDLSGRGVGMDVVKTNINKINGTINVNSKKGEGTTIEILIPLTVAIMPAMVVGVGEHLYCVPLQSVHEIVRPEEDQVYTVNSQRVMRLRDTVLPLVNMQDRLGEVSSDDGGRFTVVVGVGGLRAGLVVDRLVGQQEIVIKPLDDGYTKGGPFSGATIQDDGQVSLILDVVTLMRHAQAQPVDQAA